MRPTFAAVLLAVAACGPPSLPVETIIHVQVLPPARTTLTTAEPLQLEARVEGRTDTRVAWSGEGVSATGLFVSPTPGTFTVVARPMNSDVRASVTLQVVPPAQIAALVATPADLTEGERAELTWAVEGATEVQLDGVPQTAMSVVVAPAASRTFVLTAKNAAGAEVAAEATVTVVPAPAIDAFGATRPAVTRGEPTTLQWTTHGATEVLLDGVGVHGTAATFIPLEAEDHVLEARNALGAHVSRTVHLGVEPAPSVLAFYADRTTLTAGEHTVVRWFVAGAAELRLDGSLVTGSSAELVPSVSADHVLEARNALGVSASAQLHLAVVPAPVIAGFAADRALITAGEGTTLRWTTSEATGVRLDGAAVTGTSRAVTPTVTTAYTLEATNAAGFNVAQTAQVQVVAAPVIAAFTADAPSLTAGESTTLRWTTSGATDVRLDGLAVTATSRVVSPAVSADYVLVALNPASFSVTQTVHVAVTPAPVIASFTTDAAAITSGESTTLRWTTTGAAEVRLDGAVVAGTSAAITPASTGTHTLEARNALGFATTQTVQVAVVPAAAIASFTSARPAITTGESTVLSWSVSDAAEVRLNGSVVTGSSVAVSPGVTTAYTLEARNAAGSSVTAPLTLGVVPPIALGFAASPAAFEVGASSSLSWTATGAATLTLDGTAVSGTGVTLSPLSTTTYVLRATNSLGFETSQSVTLTVSPYPGTVWLAAGQVWLRWPDSGPLTGMQTYDVYRSTAPINALASATRVGRLFADDVRAARLKLADPNATWVLPLASGGTTALGPGEAHFTWTPRAAETSYFAVVLSGSSSPLLKFGPIDETVSPVSAHVQRTGVDAQSGLGFSDYAVWLDGRAGPDPGRADFPVMGPPSFNGAAALFRVYASPTAGAPMPGLLVLHGNGGNWLDHHPAVSNDGPDVRLSHGIVTAVDDAFAYASGSTVSTGTTRWFGAWDGFDRFNPVQSLPPNGALVHPYTLRRLLWIRDWMIANRGVDPDRVLIAGHSMGALGALTATRAYPDRFAGTLAYQGHTDVVAGFGDYLRGSEAQNLMTGLGASIAEVHDPAVLLAPGDLPPVHLVWGVTDNMVPWADKPATIAQLSALKRGHQIWWDTRTHGYPWTGHFVGSAGLRAESLVALKRNQSYPAFSAEVSPDASTSNAWGTQGGYLEWDPGSITDTAAGWNAELWLRATASFAADVPAFATVTVDVSIRRPQAFLPAPGSAWTWTLRRSADGAVLQAGALTVSAAGLVTAQGVVVPKERVQLTIAP